MERETWDRAQALLADNLQGKTRRRLASVNLLAGKLLDAAGDRLIPVHATKGQARYRYYVSRKLQHEPGSEGMRIPARELEEVVCNRIAELLADSIDLAATAQLMISPVGLAAYAGRCDLLRSRIEAREAAVVVPLISLARILDGKIEINCDSAAIATALHVARDVAAPATLPIHVHVRLTRSGRVMRLVEEGGRTVARAPDQSVIRLLIKARGWWAQLREGEIDTKQLALREGVNPSYVTRVLRLAFLAPAVIDSVLAGTLSTSVDAASLTATDAVPPIWSDQVREMTPEAVQTA